MKKIRWEHNSFYSTTKVGSVRLSCFRTLATTKQLRWYAVVWVPAVAHHSDQKMIESRNLRKSLDRAKQDAIELARNYLLDMQAGLEAEMKNFGLEGGDLR